jgi:hypothetical protein
MSYIDDIMGFNPQDLDAFQEPTSTSSYDANIYKTNPVKFSKSEDGHYRAKVRVIYNPFNFKQSVVAQRTYFIQDAEGSLLVRSKGASPVPEVYRSCPFHKAWSKLWYATENKEAKQAWAKEMLDSNNSKWVLVQVMEDENQPELVGKILAWKLPTTIYTKMTAKMNPSPESKKAPIAIMDYLFGLPLELDIAPGPDDPTQPTRKQREINYDLCDFDADYLPIMKVDGTPLFDESELDTIDAFFTARAEFVKAKAAAKKEAAQKTITDLTPAVKALYEKSFDYLKGVCFDLTVECGYQEWDEATTARVTRYLDNVVNMRDPKVSTVDATPAATPAASTEATDSPAQVLADPMASVMGDKAGDDLPF